MKTFVLMMLALAGLAAGCTTKAKARKQALAAFEAGQAQATAQAIAKSVVIVHGEVLNHEIPWTEDLTLARALAAADYRGLRDPRNLAVLRQGRTTRINVKDLLSGRTDPPLLPGDIIEISR